MKLESGPLRSASGFLLALMLVLLASCTGGKTPTLAPPPPSPAATSTAAASAPTLPGSPAPAASVSPASPTLTPAPAGATASPSAPTLSPSPSSTPAPAPSPTPAPQVTPIVAFLSLPSLAPLMSPPPGAPDTPLFGVTALALDADRGLAAAGTAGMGVLVSTDGGAGWLWSGAGLPQHSSVRDLTAAHGWLLAIVEGAGAFVSLDAGRRWEPVAGLSGEVQQVAISPDFPVDGLLFAVQGGALLRSADRAQSWLVVLPANGCPLNVVFSPHLATDGIVYAPRCDRLVRSSDRGLTWTEVTPSGPGPSLGNLQDLALDPADPTGLHLLAAGTTQGLPLQSWDGGRSWSLAYDPAQAPFAMGSLRGGVRLGPGDVRLGPGGSWYATGRAHVADPSDWLWRSTDSGSSWQPLARTANLADLTIAPDGAVWVGTADGIWLDRSGDWRLLHPGGSVPPLVDLSEPAPVALSRHGVDKYTTRLRLFEKRDGAWTLLFEVTGNQVPRRASVAPGYLEDRFLLLLAQDYGGQISIVRLRPDADQPLTSIGEIPPGPGDSLERYRIAFAADYASSGRVTVRHGYSGALYLSADRGATWSRLEPGLPGACDRNPVSGFGALWNANAELRLRLLCPLEDEQPYSGTVQSFEHGELLRLAPIADSPYDQWVYALLPGQQGRGAWATLPVYEVSAPFPQPPSGLLPPDPVFRAAWLEGQCCFPASTPVSEALGWATGAATSVAVARQGFEGGTLLWREDLDQILLLERTADGDTYLAFPD